MAEAIISPGVYSNENEKTREIYHFDIESKLKSQLIKFKPTLKG